jgi:Fusaric acid resistance protein-like
MASALWDRVPSDPGWFRDPAALEAAARLAVVVAVPFLALYFAGAELVAIWAMLGALNIVLSGFGGSRRQVVLSTAALTVAMATFALVGPLIAHSDAAVVLATFIVAFAAGWLGLLSSYWRVGGPLALIVFVIGVSLPGSVEIGVEAAGGILIGGAAALAGLLAVPTAGPAGLLFDRLATSFEAIADAVGRVIPASAGGAAVDAATESDRLGLEALRHQIDETRDFLADNAWAVAGHGPSEHLQVALIQDVERIAGDVGRLAALIEDEPLGQPERELIAPALEAVVEAIRELAASIRNRRPTDPAYLRAAVGGPGVESQGTAMIARGWLADDVMAAAANATAIPRPLGSQRRAYREELRRELSRESPYFLFGLRLGIAVAAGTWLYLALGLSDAHGLWIPVTIIVVVQPTLAGSVERTLERFGGTLVGVALALGLLALIGEQEVPTVVLFPFLLFATVYLGRIDYAVAVAFITLSVVLLFDLLEPAGASTDLERLSGTVVGIAIGAAATFALWPRSLHRTLVASAANLIDASGRCLAASQQAGPDSSRPCDGATEALLRYASAERLYVRQPGDLALDRGALYELDRASQRLLELATMIRGLAQPTRQTLATPMTGDILRMGALASALRDGCRGVVSDCSRTADATDGVQSDPLIKFLLLTARAEIDAVERAVALLRPAG